MKILTENLPEIVIWVYFRIHRGNKNLYFFWPNKKTLKKVIFWLNFFRPNEGNLCQIEKKSWRSLRLFVVKKKGKLEQILMEKRENRFLSKLNSNENSILSHEKRFFCNQQNNTQYSDWNTPHFLTLINFRYIQNKRN